MKWTDGIKLLDDKIKANQGQYDLNREAAKISASSFKDLNKYEYVTGEGFSLAQILTKALKKDDRTIKYGNDLPRNSVYNFNKYSV